ncbi:hypothetical protein OKA04_07665 [Luteolibacter flavescens]|uniref:Uncharacterized protein n=1 Tax=Luteolibacter flavescens TaxID=1859460 RepID=A0ABT3FM10_9BACT|nr:hypothetical protein [Luteolibacter flavescens]MCW1884606.1 hypothetical protein [Luteolibacter flavescens]
MDLLEEIEQHYRDPSFGGSNKLRRHLIRLQPLRDLLLEQVAHEELETSLKRFPSGAEVLLRASAKKNGKETLKVWNRVRDEWRELDRDSPPIKFEWIEGVAGVPTIVRDDEHFPACAALAEGWASTDPEAAWTAVTTGRMNEPPDCDILKGFFAGLPQDTDWSAWPSRLEALPWNKPDDLFFETSCRAFAALAFAQRWLQSDPEAAMAWFAKDRATWEEGNWVRIPVFKHGIFDNVYSLSEHAALLGEWMKQQPETASAWLSHADEILAPEEVLREISIEMEIPETLKKQIAERYEE